MYLFAVIALAAAWYFADKAWRQPRPGAIVAALAWALYAVFEFLIGQEVLCGPKCNIRVDLLVIWPLLWLASLFGGYGRGEWNGAAKVLGVISLGIIGLIVTSFVYMYVVEAPSIEKADRAPLPAIGKK